MRALVCGVSGQDGSLLAKLLLQKGYQVIGTSRDAMASSFSNLQRLGIREQVEVASMATNDFRSVLGALQRYQPDEIYNLAGQTSVGLSFEQPVEAMDSIAQSTLVLLEAIRFVDRPIRFYNAGSSECFGDTGPDGANESTPFQPRSPYAVAKATAYWLVKSFRESYGLYACTGILFNHESQLRPERFVTQKIVRGAAAIAAGDKQYLELGNIDIFRDWGWAEDYVRAMWLMLQQSRPDDYVISTGVASSLQSFVSKAFECFNLDWHDHVRLNNSFLRPSEIRFSKGNSSKAHAQLGWSATKQIDDVVSLMCKAVKMA